MPNPYFPHKVFGPRKGSSQKVPRVFISPQRYIQGEDVLDNLGTYLGLVGAAKVGLLISSGGEKRFGARLGATLDEAGIGYVYSHFDGECSVPEIEKQVAGLAQQALGCLLAIGGGKCVDAGKAVAFRLGVPLVVVPTLASNDAPCSAVSVLYTPEGVSAGGEMYPTNPAIVVVDTGIVASAAERFLVAGIGDAMATWFEARVCLQNPNARTTTGARPTLASAAMGETCAETLYADSLAACLAVRENRVDDALENVVEANTLLSGVGFESGGLAGAHAVAQAYTALPDVHANYLHGEMVAMGTLVQLLLEGRMDEARQVGTFFTTVGLPVQLSQVGMNASETSRMETLVEATLAFPYLRNLPVDISAEAVKSAIVAADELGKTITAQSGDQAYRNLQA